MAPAALSVDAAIAVLVEAKQIIWQNLLLCVSCIILARFLYLRFFHPYSDIPGPLLATISPLWKVRAALNGTIHLDLISAHRKWGKIVRVAPDEVSISDPEAIRIVYAHGANFTKVLTYLSLL